MSLQPGKLPPSVLAALLEEIPHRDPRVVVGPGIGRDAAVIEFGDRLLVAKTDPVTFATHRIGAYAVHVNANDIACMGARPAWFLASALLPAGSPESLAKQVFRDIVAACDDLEIELVGGHTEVTIGIDRPIVAGVMLGEALRDEIVLGEDIQPGDAVLLTGGVAIEGTALLAHDSANVLSGHGIPAATIDSARALLDAPGISVVRAASTICRATRPRLMHDPTEGGIATALHEMAQAARATLNVDVGAIPVLDETRHVCDALALDPMGLLASGALLAIVDGTSSETVKRALRDKGIDCEVIGRVEAGAAEAIMTAGDQAKPLPVFTRDEIARFYDECQQPGGQ
jgi:hydrogenase maturation factor